MTGRSLLPLLSSDKSGQVDSGRDFVLVGKERHVPAQEAPDLGGYPCRAIRTQKFLYIRNFHPERWPSGTPHYQRAAIPGAWYADCDHGPTKTYMIHHRDKDPIHRKLFELAFARRPAEELYDLKSDPAQLHNVASQPDYAEERKELASCLLAELQATDDPRGVSAAHVPLNSWDEADGGGDRFDLYPYLGGAPKHPDFQEPLAHEERPARDTR